MSGVRRPSRAVATAWVVVNVLLAPALVFLVLLPSLAVYEAFWGSDAVIEVPVQLASAGIDTPVGINLEPYIDARAQLPEPDKAEVLLDHVERFAWLPVLAGVLVLLRGLIGAARRDDPFTAATVRRIRLIGGVLVAGSLLAEAAETLARQELWQRLPPSEGDIGVEGFGWPVPAMLAGLLAYVLAEIFAHGVMLREDVEGTI